MKNKFINLIILFFLFNLLMFCNKNDEAVIYYGNEYITGQSQPNIDYDYYNGDMPDWYGVVVRVADGDTFYINYFSEIKMGVRIFGVDTPETKDRRKTVQYWGPEASAFSKQYLMTGTIVKLNFDGEITGPFGRLLAEPWIWNGAEWINYSKILLETGNAFIYAKYPIPIDKLHEYMEYQQTAINKCGFSAYRQ